MNATLSITSQSKAEIPAGRKVCTRVLAYHEALSLEVCRAGELVALRCHTAAGTVVIYASEAAFTRGCRGRLDANGNPFRDPSDEPASVRLAREAATLPPPPTKVGQGKDPRVQAACENAWRLYAGGTYRRRTDAAQAAGVAYSTFAEWIRCHHPETGREIHREHSGRRGQAASLRAAAAAGAPLLKPSGGL